MISCCSHRPTYQFCFIGLRLFLWHNMAKQLCCLIKDQLCLNYRRFTKGESRKPQLSKSMRFWFIALQYLICPANAMACIPFYLLLKGNNAQKQDSILINREGKMHASATAGIIDNSVLSLYVLNYFINLVK